MASQDVEAAQQPLLNDDDPEARTASHFCGKQTQAALLVFCYLKKVPSFLL